MNEVVISNSICLGLIFSEKVYCQLNYLKKDLRPVFRFIK